MKAVVSAIIPNYECARWLPEVIESCLQQGECLKEVIIVDDDSKDNSWEILTRYKELYPGIIKIYRNREKGGNNARNYGFSLSSGDFIQWLDADDQLLPGKLDAQIKAFADHPDADIVYSDWQLNTYNETSELILQEFKKHRQYDDFLLELLKNNWSPPHTYLLKRSIAEKLAQEPAWNPGTPVLQDREYFTLAALAGARFLYAEGFVCIYNRWNKMSVSRNRNIPTLLGLLQKFRERIAGNDGFDEEKKTCYLRVIITTRLLTLLSGRNPFLRDKELKSGNICWDIVNGYGGKIKLLIALAVNIF